MIELIKDTPDKGWFGDKDSGVKKWELSCDICGRKKIVNRKYYTYGFGDPGYVSPIWGGFSTFHYGEFNKREGMMCPHHKDAEIEAKVKELK